MFPSICFQNDHIVEQNEEDYLLVVFRSHLILRGWIQLSSHYSGVLYNFPSSPQSLSLFSFLRCEIPHPRSQGPLAIWHLFLISQIPGLSGTSIGTRCP